MPSNREKTEEQLFGEFQRLNEGNDHIDWDQIRRMLAVIDCAELPVPKPNSDDKVPPNDGKIGPKEDGQERESRKPVSEWTEEDIGQWAKNCKAGAAKRKRDRMEEQKHNKKKGQATPPLGNVSPEPQQITDTCAVVARAVQIHYGFRPRVVQLMATLLMLLHNTDLRGRLSQVDTGQGKTIIVCMLSVVRALCWGDKVAVLTSSPVLAKQGPELLHSLYAMLSLTVAHNTEDDMPDEKLREVYSADIVYGDIGSFQAHYLEHHFKKKDILGDFAQLSAATAIIDECDFMFIDETAEGKILMLSFHTPGMEYLANVYIIAWTILCSCFANKIQPEQWAKLDEESKREFFKFVAEQLQTCLEHLVKGTLDQLDNAEMCEQFSKMGILRPPIPCHLKEFALKQCTSWAQSTVAAMWLMHEDQQYRVKRREGRLAEIVPVNFAHNGALEFSLQWEGGLHQELQCKHLLRLSPETLVTSLMTNMAFVKKFSTVYGVTGTLGTAAHRDFLSRHYHVDTVIVPRYVDSPTQQYPNIITFDDSGWYERIVETVRKESVDNGRPVLIVGLTIAAVNAIKNVLAGHGLHATRDVYNDNSEWNNVLDKGPFEPGDRVLGTLLVGRGFDNSTSEQSEANGGLHVIGTFLALCRDSSQLFGRTCRQGNKGTAHLIINLSAETELRSHFSKKFSVALEELPTEQLMEELHVWQQERESEALADCEQKQIRHLQLQEQLFNKFVEFTENVRQLNRRNQEYVLKQLEELWGFWLKFHMEDINEENDDDDGEERDAEEVAKKAEEKGRQMLEEMDKFLADKRDLLDKFDREWDLELSNNPSYLVLMGRQEYHSTILQNAVKAYERAIKLDTDPATNKCIGYSVPAHYYLAQTLVDQGARKFGKLERKPRAECVGYQQRALELLEEARALIQQSLLPWVGAQLSGRCAENIADLVRSEYVPQLTARVQLLQMLDSQCETLAGVIRACPEDKLCKSKSGEKRLADCVSKSDAAEVKEFAEFGVDSFYTLEYVAPPPSLNSIFWMCFLGAIQVGLGVVCAMCGAVVFSAALFSAGIQDCVKGLKAIFFDTPIAWGQWVCERLVGYLATTFSACNTWITKQINKLSPKLRKITDFLGLTSQKCAATQTALEVEQQLIGQTTFRKATAFCSVQLKQTLKSVAKSEFRSGVKHYAKTELDIDIGAPEFNLLERVVFGEPTSTQTPLAGKYLATKRLADYAVDKLENAVAEEIIRQEVPASHSLAGMLLKTAKLYGISCVSSGIKESCGEALYKSAEQEKRRTELAKALEKEMMDNDVKVSEKEIENMAEFVDNYLVEVRKGQGKAAFDGKNGQCEQENGSSNIPSSSTQNKPTPTEIFYKLLYNDMKFDFDPRRWAGWSSNDPCECGTQNYVSVSVRHIEVRMCSDGTRIIANGVRILSVGITEAVAGRFQDITHEAIDVLFKCELCPQQFRRTYEIINGDVNNGEGGKIREWGHYKPDGVFGAKYAIRHPFRYDALEQVFEEMWDAQDYKFLSHNCKNWSKLFMDKLRSRRRDGG